MKTVDITLTDTGLLIRGPIQFDQVIALRNQGNRLIGEFEHEHITVDLSGVTACDASGLSLCVRWMQYAKQHNKTVSYINMPITMQALSRVCGVGPILGLREIEGGSTAWIN